MQHEIDWARHLLLVTFASAMLVPGGAVAQENAEGSPGQPAPPIVVVAEPQAAPAPATETAPKPEPQGSPVLSIGASGLLSGVRIADDIDVHAMWGFDVAVHVAPWIYVGARRVGFALAPSNAGDRYALGGSPMVGFMWSLSEVFALFGELGVAVQARSGTPLETSIGVAPFGGGGARFRIADWISLGIEGALHVPVTDAFLFSGAVLPRGAVELAGGAGVMFHVR